MQGPTDDHIVLFTQSGHENLAKSVQERFRQSFSVTAFADWILTCKYFCVGMQREGSVQLRDVNFVSVVEDCIEPLQDGLAREVELVEQDPVAALHRVQEGSVPPLEVSRVPALHREVRPEQVRDVGLVGEVDPRHLLVQPRGERLHQARLPYTRATLQQHRLIDLQSPRDKKMLSNNVINKNPFRYRHLIIFLMLSLIV